MPEITRKSANRVIIGKTYWKNVILPKILYCSEIINFTKSEIANLQITENTAYRHIFQAPFYTATAAVRGEIGSSTMENRILKSTLNYVKYILGTEDNDLLKNVFLDLFENSKLNWLKSLKNNLNKFEIDLNDLKMLSKNQIKQLINFYDKNEWIAEIKTKKTLNIPIFIF